VEQALAVVAAAAGPSPDEAAVGYLVDDGKAEGAVATFAGLSSQEPEETEDVNPTLGDAPDAIETQVSLLLFHC
jgi:hypothetical protein